MDGPGFDMNFGLIIIAISLIIVVLDRKHKKIKAELTTRG